MIYGLIIAAGNQRRFQMDTPKALVSIGGSTLLDKNIRKMSTVCDSVIVVCSRLNEHHFKDYPTIVIDSGLGCGDAVYKAIISLPGIKCDDTCIIQWGDSSVDEELYREMINMYTGNLVIPCKIEDDPYVCIESCKDNTVKVLFSKYGDTSHRGLHDMSTFYGNICTITRFSEMFIDKFFNGITYDHCHGNEFQFLDLLNDVGMKAVAYESQYNGFSFNTVEEMISLDEK